MDAVELLAREDEFKRLNRQLEKKSESLMREIENNMQKQDIFSEFSPNLTLSPKNHIKKHCCTPQTTPHTPEKKQPKHGHTKECTPKRLNNEENSLHKESSPKSSSPKSSIEKFEKSIFNGEKNINVNTRTICDFCAESRNNKNDTNMEFLCAFVTVNVKDGILPPSFSRDRISIENVCKFLSSKIKLMQEQMDRLQNTINTKVSQCEGHLTQLAELESERMSLLNKTNNMKSGTADMRAKLMAAQKRFEEKEKQYKEQRSSTDRLTAELKRVKLKMCNLEARCISQEQAIDSLKQQLEITKKAEKDFRESTRSLSVNHQASISKLEAQIKYQTTRINKQNALIDNLRKQVVLLTTDGAVRNLEKDYNDFLNQDL